MRFIVMANLNCLQN